MKLPTEGELEVLKIICATHLPLHGYEIGKKYSGNVYQSLDALEAKKLIYCTGIDPNNGNPRLKYRPTAQGSKLVELCEQFPD